MSAFCNESMLGLIAHAFPYATFAAYYYIVALSGLIADRLLKNRWLWLSLLAGFLSGVGLLWYFQYQDKGWYFFARTPQSIATYYRFRAEWFSYALLIPDVLKWYAFPVYVTSIVIRLNRKRVSIPRDRFDTGVAP